MADGLVTEFRSPDAVDDIMTEAKPSYWALGVVRVCYAEGWEHKQKS